MGVLALALGRRLLQAVLVALIVGVLCFWLVHLLPGDMALRIAAGRYGYDLVSVAAADAVRAELGLDRPAALRLLEWMASIARFDLGVSLVTGDRVIDEIHLQLGHTVMLSLGALALSLLIGPPLGVLAGLRPGGVVDRLTLVLAAAFRATPAFLLGVVLIHILALQLDLLPAAGFDEPAHVILPALTLALIFAAASCRVARDATADVVDSPQFQFARTKGLSDMQTLRRHGLRNAGVPVVAYLGMQLVHLVEGVVVVESLFAWPGIGHALVHAIVARDVPMVQGTALVLGLFFVLLNMAVDVACLAIDPRRRAQ